MGTKFAESVSASMRLLMSAAMSQAKPRASNGSSVTTGQRSFMPARIESTSCLALNTMTRWSRPSPMVFSADCISIRAEPLGQTHRAALLPGQLPAGGDAPVGLGADIDRRHDVLGRLLVGKAKLEELATLGGLLKHAGEPLSLSHREDDIPKHPVPGGGLDKSRNDLLIERPHRLVEEFLRGVLIYWHKVRREGLGIGAGRDVGCHVPGKAARVKRVKCYNRAVQVHAG